ncbi:hypothetical protein ZIOFF_008116 [Zingiber officinale]|uniref:Uncharacterized protein n=1 Tax=Zingiber officinale TaxID=94328 RepID=A0A8J5I318_ZINOF|nr:hypothetical protein ZIOFF_008116 [Zingiber officinale]
MLTSSITSSTRSSGRPSLAPARMVGYGKLPDEADAVMLDAEDFLRRFHHVLFEIHVVGTLVCPDTGHRFPINNGIPTCSSMKMRYDLKLKITVFLLSFLCVLAI